MSKAQSGTERAVEVRWQAASVALDGDGAPLAARHCVPVGLPVQAQVVLAGAVGVPQRFYTAFAQWLAAHGYAVTTFDYRDHAESLQGPLRRARADLLDWGRDCATVAQQVRSHAPELPLYWIGHSVGAQLPGSQGTAMPIDGMLVVASGSGYWRDNAWPTRRKALWWWWLIAPLLTGLCGCLPGKRWGLIGDLPAGVLWQWRRWCLHPQYALGVEGPALRAAYDAARYPLHALSIEDDEMMSWRSTSALLGWYSQAPQTVERLRPSDAGDRPIGHFGFFRAPMQALLWPRALAVLQRWQQARTRPTEAQGWPSKERRRSNAKMGAPIHPGQAELFSEKHRL